MDTPATDRRWMASEVRRLVDESPFRLDLAECFGPFSIELRDELRPHSLPAISHPTVDVPGLIVSTAFVCPTCTGRHSNSARISTASR
jgi:hypothetical protein